MVDFCTWYVTGANFGNPTVGGKGGAFIKDWASAAKQQAPTGWITAIDATSGRALWQYHAEAQTMAGLLPTKSGLLLAGDSHGHLLAFNKQNGALLASIDTGGALNNGLISYAVGGQQYVAATVGGGTENPSTVAGPLRVSVYGLGGSGPPKVITLDRLVRSSSARRRDSGSGVVRRGLRSMPRIGRGWLKRAAALSSEPAGGPRALEAVPDDRAAANAAPLPRCAHRQRCGSHRRIPADEHFQMRPQRAAELQTAAAAAFRRNSCMASRLFRIDLAEVHQLPSGGQSQPPALPAHCGQFRL
jgi:hypothetical protein